MIHSHHLHYGCDHQRLKHCKSCDVVYCRDCGKEWGSSNYSFALTSSGTNGYTVKNLAHTGHVH